MPILISLILFLLLMVAISIYGYRLYARPGRIIEQLGTPVAAAEPQLVSLTGQPQRGRLITVIQTIGEKMPISPADASSARRYLIAAGYRSESAVKVYYGMKIVGCIVFLLVALFLRDAFTSVPVLRIVFLAAGGLAGYFGPNLVLEKLVDKRQERLKLSLPDALDLMIVCMEAGLGLDQAVVNVSRELHITHKDISDELSLVTLEMRAGKRRSEALRNLADRTGETELRKLISILIQADRFGTSIGEALRTHSDFMRVKRRQEAEERAGKVGVKLVFPIFFFILPSMLIVAAGPGLLQIFKYLFPMMSNFGQ